MPVYTYRFGMYTVLYKICMYVCVHVCTCRCNVFVTYSHIHIRGGVCSCTEVCVCVRIRVCLQSAGLRAGGGQQSGQRALPAPSPGKGGQGSESASAGLAAGAVSPLAPTERNAPQQQTPCRVLRALGAAGGQAGTGESQAGLAVCKQLLTCLCVVAYIWTYFICIIYKIWMCVWRCNVLYVYIRIYFYVKLGLRVDTCLT